MTRAYELMIILDGKLDEPVAQSRLKSLGEGITAAGGVVHGKADWWGKRRFAYPINKQEDGYYVVYNLTATGGALNDFERSLRIADDVVRHKLFRLPDAEAERRGLVGAAPTA
jgi:small subunit ribosomal protein S6